MLVASVLVGTSAPYGLQAYTLPYTYSTIEYAQTLRSLLTSLTVFSTVSVYAKGRELLLTLELICVSYSECT